MKRHTIRTRIALVFGTAFLAIGALLLGGVYLLTQHGTDAVARNISSAVAVPATWAPARPTTGDTLPRVLFAESPADTISLVSHRVSQDVANAAARQQLLWSAVALAAAALLAAVVGWWAAARVLRPVHQMTTTVRRIGATSLDERLAQRGPRDEITDLADTFDDLLDRLQTSFTAQRRFTANASHELRTPLTVQRSLIQVGLEDPSPDELDQIRTDLLESNRRSEKLINALLLLARGQHGPQTHEAVDLTAIVVPEAEPAEASARDAKVTVHLQQEPTTVQGDQVLLAHMVRNLIDNAIVHNHPGGTVDISIDEHRLLVVNTGLLLDVDTTAELLEPFRRGMYPRLNFPGYGSGLGLSIVDAIATAHEMPLSLQPNSNGGLTAEIRIGDS